MAQSDLTLCGDACLSEIAEQQGFELVDVELVREGAAGICGFILTNPTVLP